MLAHIGVMQGRLLPPVGGRLQSFPMGRWSEEFPLAREAGLSLIEWIYEIQGEADNPLRTDAGIDRLLTLSEENGVHIRSICADYFMDRPLVRTEGAELAARLDRLHWLLQRANRLGATRIVLPFVDDSAITEPDDARCVVECLYRVLPVVEETNVELHLESSLPPLQLADLLGLIVHPLIKVNYDTGNSASLGYDAREEFETYGARIGSIHIKDRLYRGHTVPLGSGNVDFPACFDSIRRSGYSGDFILQVARGTDGDELQWARSNCAFVIEHLSRQAA